MFVLLEVAMRGIFSIKKDGQVIYKKQDCEQSEKIDNINKKDTNNIKLEKR